jgi:hypothetical protein
MAAAAGGERRKERREEFCFVLAALDETGLFPSRRKPILKAQQYIGPKWAFLGPV